MKLRNILNLSFIIFSVNGVLVNENNEEFSESVDGVKVDHKLVKKDESIPTDPNIYLTVYNPAVDNETPTWSNKKSHTIKYNSWLNNPDVKSADYDIDSLDVVAKKSSSEIEICKNIKLNYGEITCDLKADLLSNGLWEISVFPSNKKNWIMNKFNIIITEGDKDYSEEFLIPITTHSIGNGTPFYITSPVSKSEEPTQFSLGDKVEIKWKAFEINGYNKLNQDTSVNVKVAKYNPPIRSMENGLKWTNVCEDVSVSNEESGCEINTNNLKDGFYWVRVYEGKDAVAQTFIELKNTKSDSQSISASEKTTTIIDDGVMLHIISPVIDKDGNFENWNIKGNEKKEIKWKAITGDKKTAVDVYAVLINENGEVSDKHRLCSEIEISAESCTFAINNLEVGTWELYIENVKTNNKYEKTFVIASTSGSSKSANKSSNNTSSSSSSSNNKSNGTKNATHYIPAGEKSPYRILLKDIEDQWDITKDIQLNWTPISINSYKDYPELSVFAISGNNNITLCENIEIDKKTCTVPANTIQEDGQYTILWMKDGLIIDEKIISTSDNDSTKGNEGMMQMENLISDENRFKVSYDNISSEGFPQWKKDVTQKITGLSDDVSNITIAKATDKADEIYNVVCDYKDKVECVFKIPDGVKRGEVNSHWIVETVNKAGKVMTRLPIRLIE